jgi:DNA polymerase I-like protein with 3'-5' exonuclease and polymerase domains
VGLSKLKDFKVKVREKDKGWPVVIWEPGMPTVDGTLIALDTETELIVDGKPGHPVLYQIADMTNRVCHLVWWEHWEEYSQDWYAKPSFKKATIAMHNAAYDLRILGINFQDGRPDPWMDKVDRDVPLVVDTGLRFLLIQLESGSSDLTWKLDYAAASVLHVSVSKDKDIRLSFSRNMEVTEDHAYYGAKDTIITGMLAEEMEADFMPTEDIQLKGSIALASLEENGLAVDIEKMKQIGEEKQELVKRYLGTLSAWGFWTGSDKNNQAVQDQVLRNLEERLSISFPRTPTGDVKTEGIKTRFYEEGLPVHPFAGALVDYVHENKMISTYLDPEIVGKDGRVHAHFNIMVRTGRTSCSRPNLQNIPRGDGIREIYIAAPGKVLLDIDYSQLELCALAETCYTRYGKSVMQDVINSGEDIHRWFGANIMKAVHGTPDSRNWRQMAKATNFGFPGGLGIKTFRAYALNSYGVELSSEECQMLKDLWLDSFPEMQQHLSPTTDVCCTNPLSGEEFFLASTITGRERHKCYFCPACNFPFQALSADGAKLSLWKVYRAGYKMVNFVHDEIMTELAIDKNLQMHADRINQMMIDGMRQVIPNTTIRTEGALMLRWHKKAEPVFTEDGRLMIWRPKEEGDHLDPFELCA